MARPVEELLMQVGGARSSLRGLPRRPVIILALMLAGAAGALALVSVSARRTYRALEAAAAQRQMAYDFLMALRQLRQHVGEARVGLTGFAVTRDSVYHATYATGMAGLATDTGALRALARGEPTLQGPLDRLGTAVVAYADAMSAAMRTAERGPSSALGPELRRSRDAVLLEAVRGAIVALEREQLRLMDAGAREVSQAVRRSRTIITGWSWWVWS